MHHHQLIHRPLSPQTPSPTIPCSFFNHHKHPEIFSFSLSSSHLRTNSQTVLDHHGCRIPGIASTCRPPLSWRMKRRERRWVVYAVERESGFKIDPDKARQALNELDQQLDTLSRKQVNPPKIRASSLNSNLKEQMKEESTGIQGSFLAFTAFGLFLFSLFYNILFITVIKPAIDGP